MSDVLNVAAREQMGTTHTRRLRSSGQVPAVLYGHGEGNVHLSVPKKEVELLLRHQSKHVELAGAVSDHAIVKDLQWDPLGIEVLHMDLFRISLDEKVTLSVPVKLRGEAIGLQHHGMLKEILHDVEIRVPAVSIPDEVVLNINDLDVGQTKTAGDIQLPEGSELVTDASLPVVVMSVPSGKSADDEEGTGPSEPEVIGEKKED